MVTRRAERPGEGYLIRVTLPQPWGRVGYWQTGVHTLTGAKRIEAWLMAQALERPAVVDGIVGRRWSLRDAWVAHLRGTLDALVAGLADPLLADAVAEYKALCQDGRARGCLAQLERLADPGVRISWLSPVTIPQLYAKALAGGQKPNTVRRGLHRAVTELLAFKLGGDRRDQVLKGVRVPGEDDRREVELTPKQLERLLGAIALERFRWMVLLAIHTTADRKPLLEMRPPHFDDALGELTIPDRKAPSRWRRLRLSEDARTVARLACAGLGERDRLFPWKASRVRDLWEAARTAAELPRLRFKDLRHLLPGALNAMGLPEAEVAKLLGHAPGSRMTGKYIKAVGDPSTLAAASARLGLTGAHIRAS